MTLIALHLLQNHAPSNLNRDDNGDPKDAFFGGVRRARISSQSLKRAIRHSEIFESYFTGLDVLATRSKLWTQINDYLNSENVLDPVMKQRVQSLAARIGNAGKEASEEASDEETASDDEVAATGQLMFLTRREVEVVAQRLIEMVNKPASVVVEPTVGSAKKGRSTPKVDEKALVKPVGFDPHSVDIAMFGRMTTSSPFKDVEASVQVAHALSTHRVEQEFDFFTAVDDLKEETGAGMLGEVAFNSATYYKYFNIHWEGLVENLGGNMDLARKAIQALIHAAMMASPSGKQNSFAAHNPPDWVMLEIRPQNTPLSYANAFVKPVRPSGNASLMDASIAAITHYVTQIDRMYMLPVERVIISTQENTGGLSDVLNWITAHAALNG